MISDTHEVYASNNNVKFGVEVPPGQMAGNGH